MIRAFLVLVMIACTAVFGSMAYAQAGNLARSEAEMTRLEALAEVAEQRVVDRKTGLAGDVLRRAVVVPKHGLVRRVDHDAVHDHMRNARGR